MFYTIIEKPANASHWAWTIQNTLDNKEDADLVAWATSSSNGVKTVVIQHEKPIDELPTDRHGTVMFPNGMTASKQQ